jgi:hypothetical protein
MQRCTGIFVRAVAALLGLIIVPNTIGCGGVRQFPVEGLVSLDGSPENDAAITFIPAAGGRPGLASTDANGRFTVREAGMVNGLLAGRYRVVVFKAVISRGRTISAPAPGPHPDGQPVPMIDLIIGDERIERYIVPERYANPETSGLEVTVAGPTKDLIFSLTTAP